MTNPEQTPPPVGEEIHLPGPSLLPILNAAGITLALIGITLGWVLSVAGLDAPDNPAGLYARTR